MLFLQHMPGGHSERRCGRNKSSQAGPEPRHSRADSTLFDFENVWFTARRPSGWQFKEYITMLCTPRRPLVCRAFCCTLMCGHSYLSLSSVPSKAHLLLKKPSVRTPAGVQAAPTEKTITFWENQQDLYFRALLVVAQVRGCVHTHTSTQKYR